MSKKGRWIPQDEKYADDRIMITCNGYIADTKTDDVFLSVQALINKYNGILKENEQLKQRNTNQYNQLTELWQIIEEENWEKLITMKKQLKEDEERLQKEWMCYE